MNSVPLRPKGIVGVHEGVDSVVHAPKPRGEGGRHRDDSIPCVDAHRRMVVPVEEWEGALTKDNEECVTKLHEFRQRKQPAPQ